jgi:hypothetical protein
MRSFPLGGPQHVQEAIAQMNPPPGRDPGLLRARGMWAKQDRPAYRSLGLKPFVDKAAALLSYTDRSLLLRTEQLWHMSQIQNSLGYLGDQSDPKARKEIFDRIMSIRNALATAIVAVDMAIGKAAVAFDLPMQRLLIDLAVPISEPFTVPDPGPLTVDPAPSVPQWEEEETQDVDTRQLRDPGAHSERSVVRPASKRRSH